MLHEGTSRVKHQENSLAEYVPGHYGCILDGILLANGDLKARDTG